MHDYRRIEIRTVITHQDAGEIGGRACSLDTNPNAPQQMLRPALPLPHGTAHVLAKKQAAQDDLAYFIGGVKSEIKKSPKCAKFFHAERSAGNSRRKSGKLVKIFCDKTNERQALSRLNE